MRRLGIVLFFDKEGIVDDYFMFYLEKLRPFYQELCIVVNEFLNDEGKAKFEKSCDKVIIRKNEGMDIMAYKEAIESYGFEKIKEYDEMLLTNYTSFGPFYPLTEMYDVMDKKECDLWSIYRWPIYKSAYSPNEDYHHLPSFFLSYRKSLMNSPHFKEYWDTLPEIKTYKDSCWYHEQRQTPYFEKLGFKGSSYIDIEKYKEHFKTDFPFDCMYQMVTEDRCPFIKRRQLFFENGSFPFACGCIIAILKFLKEKNLYDISMLAKNIIRTQKIEPLKIKISWIIKSKIALSRKKREKYRQKIQTICANKELDNYLYKALNRHKKI